MDDGPTISTHVLDAQSGRPRQGVFVHLLFARFDASDTDDLEEASGVTDEDGRIRRLTDRPLRTDGDYTMTFRLDGPFFTEMSLTFKIDDASRSYHVPLLMAPYSMTTYRGS